MQDTIGTKEAETLTYKQQVEAMRNEKLYRKLFWGEMNDSLDDEEWIARLQKTFEIAKDGEIVGLKIKSTGKFVPMKS